MIDLVCSPYPVLYSFRRCPYAMRARLALWASDQVCELREVVLARKPAALLAASAKGTVPVLVMANGQVIDQSLEIMLWALRQHDPLGWLRDEAQRPDILQWVAQCDGIFKFHLDRYKYPNRFGLPEGTDHRAQGAVFLDSLNERLSQSSYVVGASESFADMAIAPFVRQFAHTDAVWFARQPWPALQTWLVKFEASNAYQQVMVRHAAWVPEQLPVLFPKTLFAII